MTQGDDMSRQARSYADAGVHIHDADSIKERIQQSLKPTLDSRSLGVGSFGSLFHLQGYNDPVLVSSCDGVGTKLKLAALLGRNRTVGHDIVNHCINDILCCGAMPLFFLDYIAMARLDTSQIADIVDGIATACRDSGVALIGGETTSWASSSASSSGRTSSTEGASFPEMCSSDSPHRDCTRTAIRSPGGYST